MGLSVFRRAKSFSNVAASYSRCTTIFSIFLVTERFFSRSPEISNSPNTATNVARKLEYMTRKKFIIMILKRNIINEDSHPGWQCAAVITYSVVIKTPPHLFLVNNPSHVDSRTKTCQGHAPNVAPLPPTILPDFTCGRTPHSFNYFFFDYSLYNR